MKPIVIVGAGLAGLTCARQLQESGIPFRIFEAGDDVGGRVRTDDVDGFLLDRGFQVMLSAYPACQRWLDTAALDLRAFEPGAAIRIRHGWSIPAAVSETCGRACRRISDLLGTNCGC